MSGNRYLRTSAHGCSGVGVRRQHHGPLLKMIAITVLLASCRCARVAAAAACGCGSWSHRPLSDVDIYVVALLVHCPAEGAREIQAGRAPSPSRP